MAGMNDYGLTLVTAATAEPLTLDEAKKQVEIERADHYHDAYLTSLIKAARNRAEIETSRQIMTATWDLTLDKFPDGYKHIKVPLPPLQSVTSVTYLDDDGDTQTFSSAAYKVITGREPGRIALRSGYAWYSTRNEEEVVTVRFVAGYTSAANVPDLLKIAMRMMIGHWFENREEVVVGNYATVIPKGAEDILYSCRPGDGFFSYSGDDFT